MPTGNITLPVNNANCKGDNSEQDEWLNCAPKSAYLRARIEKQIKTLFVSVDQAAGKDEYESFEKELILEIFCLGRLFIALFLCLWQERAPVATKELHGKELYRRQPLKPRLLGTYFGKVRYWRHYLEQMNGRTGGYFPIDLALGLVADGFSHSVLSRAVKLATKMSYIASTIVFKSFVGWSPSHKSVEQAVLGFNKYTAEWVEYRPVPEGDGEVLIMQFDSKATPTAKVSELQKRRGKQTPNPYPESPRHRARHQRQKRGSKERRKKGDKSKNGKMCTLVVMYTLKKDIFDDGQPMLKGPINRWIYASYAPKCHAFAIARREADKRGFDKNSGKMIQIITDGDEDLEKYAMEFFPEAQHSLDVIHAIEYLWKAGACLYSEGSHELRGWVEKQKDRLYAGEAKTIVRCLQVSKHKARSESSRKTLEQIANYLNKRLHMMNYDQLEKADLELSSGIVEGAVRYVVSQRFDEGGMRWVKERSEALLQLRCIEINGEWDSFIKFMHMKICRKQRSSRRAQKLLQNTPCNLPSYGIV